MSAERCELYKGYHRVIKWLICSDVMSFNLKLFLLFQDCISLGSGEPSRSAYHSFVLYHNNSPRWGEIIKLPIPIDRFRGSHLRFEFRHCSSECKIPPREIQKSWGLSVVSLHLDEVVAGWEAGEGAKLKSSEGALLISWLLHLFNSTLKTSWMISAGQNIL